MRINHNIQALNAYRNLYQNQSATSKNLEKLSSGLRVNRAADDAAGLAISEKMRSQIRGLNQAETNSLDGVSLMQVAEGAMTEVHSMLQRMRELTVQAANDTNTLSDREAIQLEIDELLKEIDSIADKTEFNTRRLLDGSSAADAQYIVGENTNTNIVNVPVIKNAEMKSGTYAISVTSEPQIVNTLNQPGAGISQANVLSFKTIGGVEAVEGTKAVKTSSIVDVPAVTLNSTNTVVDGTYTLELTANETGFTTAKIGALDGAFNADQTVVTFTNGLSFDLTGASKEVGTTKFSYVVETTGAASAVQTATATGANAGAAPDTISLAADASISSGTYEVIITENGPTPANFDVKVGTDTITVSPGGEAIFTNGLKITIPAGQVKDTFEYIIVNTPANLGTKSAVEVLPTTIPGAALETNNTVADGKYALEVVSDGTAVTVAKLNGQPGILNAAKTEVTFDNGMSFNLTNVPTTAGVTNYEYTIETTGAVEATPGTMQSKLPLGEYTITVSGFNPGSGTTPSNATVEIFGPDGFSIGSLATVVGGNVDPAAKFQEIGISPNSLLIDISQITQAGTAKVQLEAEMQVEVSRIGKNANNAIRDAVTGEFLEKTPITFNKSITTRNGKVTHGGLEMNFDSKVQKGESAFDLTNKSLTFQIGANTNQSLNIDVPQLSTVKLGINGLQILSHEEANRSLHKIDQAITAISATRAKLGATQNRLEHTISNLQVTAENLTSAESRIRDADMAKEMTDFTKNNILNQSAQAMLAQANQLPQGVLQLLQG